MTILMFSDLLETNQFPFFVSNANRRHILIESRFIADDSYVQHIQFGDDSEIICELDECIRLIGDQLDI